MASIPYARPAYDPSASTARMSDLIRARGTSAANAIYQQGAANAYLWGNLINTAGKTMGNLIEYQAGAPEREVKKQQLERAKREERKAFEEDEIDQQTAGMPPEQAAEIARGYGHPKKAQEILDRAAHLEIQASQVADVRAKPQREKEAEERRKWDDQYKRLTAWPMAAKEAAQIWSTSVKDQADMDARLESTKRLATFVGRPDLLEAFTPTFGPQTEGERTAALNWLTEKVKPEINKFAVFHAAWVEEHGVPKTAKEGAAMLKAYEATQPQTGGEKPLSGAQKGIALRARDAALARVEAQWRKDWADQYTPGQTTPSAEALADLEQRKLDVENSYRTQIGEEPVATIQEAGFRPTSNEAELWRQSAHKALEDAFLAKGDTSDEAKAKLQAEKDKISAEYHRRKTAEMRGGSMADLVQPGAAPASTQPAMSGSQMMPPTAPQPTPPTTAPAPPAPPAPPAAGQAPPRYGPAMTERRAIEILTAKNGRPPTPADIKWFMSKYPYEVIR